MALIEMDFAMGGGEHYEETLLWTNQSPSTSMSSQLITLSDDYTQYDLIKVVFKCNSSGSDDSKRYIRNVYQTPEDIRHTRNEVNYACAGLGRKGSSTSVCDFIGIGTSNTNVNYYHLDTSNLIIPLYIYGVRKVGGSSDEKEITSIDPQLTDIAVSAYTIPADGMVYVRVINASNNAPTLTLDGIIQTTPTSVLVESRYQWIYAFYVKTGQVIQVTFGSGTGRATYLSLIRIK